MIDINKQIIFWKDGAVEDLSAAINLIEKQHILQSLFFLHLSLEKMLKALVCRNINDIAPRLHNLVRLAQIADLTLLDEQLETLAQLNAFNIEGRYPDTLVSTIDTAKANDYLTRGRVLFEWLKEQL